MQGFDLRSEGFEDWLREERSRRAEHLPQAHSRPITPQRASVAVLAFENVTGDDGIFADGVVHEITGALSRVGEFDVIARQSAFALKNCALPIPEIARQLGCSYVVEGAVRRHRDRARVSVQLVRGVDGHVLWAEQFDERLDDIFDVQDRISAQLSGRLSSRVRAAEIVRVSSLPPRDRTAYEFVLSAYPHFWALRREENRRAGELLDEAIARDPQFGIAAALRAWVHAQETTYMWAVNPAKERAKAMALADRSAACAGEDVGTLIAVAGTYAQASDDLALARTFVRRVLDLDPNNAWAWIRQGWLHQYVGEVEPALEAFDRAERLSPLDPFIHQITFGRAAAVYRWSDDPKAGLELIEEGLRRHPAVVWPLRMVAVAQVRLGNIDAARAAVDKLLQALPHLSVPYLKACLPPIAAHFDDVYFRCLEEAGMPTN